MILEIYMKHHSFKVWYILCQACNAFMYVSSSFFQFTHFTSQTTMETTFGANSAPTGVRARGRSFQDGEFHSPPGSEKVRVILDAFVSTLNKPV